jgi:hypothetical protein
MPPLYVEGATKPSPKELFERLKDNNLYRIAYQEGQNFSTWLEDQDPTEDYGPEDRGNGVDAFGRQMMVAGIRTNSDHRRGIWSPRFEVFEQSDAHRALVPEWAARVWKKAATGASQSTRAATIGADDFGVNSWIRPYADAAQVRQKLIQPAIPLDRLVALTTPVDGDAYRSFYLTEPTGDEYRMVRVGQTAEIPRAKLTGGEHVVRLYKYGRALEISYEQLRRQRIDWVALQIARMAIQSETDKVATVLDVIINGDGNAGTAATSYNMTALDALATPGTMSLKAWLSFKFKFANPYALTTALAQEAVALQLALLNVGSANVPLVSIQQAAGFGSVVPINPELRDAVGLGVTTNAPTLKVVGLDDRLAVERVVEIGSTINEVDKWITRQVQIITMTEVEGYGIFDQNATKIMDINA